MTLKKMLKSVILLILINHCVSTWGCLYSELEQLGGSCFPQDSCLEPRSEEEDHLWNNSSCECGPHCIRFGTCCADSPNVGYVLQNILKSENCRKFPGMPNAVMLVSKCPDRCLNEYNNDIKSMCEDAKMEVDPIATIPVTNFAKQITYKNYFCALCNCDGRDISFWNIELHFKTKQSAQELSNVTHDSMLENLIYHDDDKSWGIMNNNYFYPIKFKFLLPNFLLKSVKKCFPNIISQCDPSFENVSEFQHKCDSYYAPIKVKTDLKTPKYRNIHCALCNNVNITESRENMCKLEIDVGSKRDKTSFSFALLLDINPSDGEIVGKVKQCKMNETWDPFFKKCRSLVCALPGYVMKDGKCVQS